MTKAKGKDTRVPCPTCGKQAPWDKEKNPWRPFCSERCKLIDLGEWFEESHRIAGDPAYPPESDSEPH